MKVMKVMKVIKVMKVMKVMKVKKVIKVMKAMCESVVVPELPQQDHCLSDFHLQDHPLHVKHPAGYGEVYPVKGGISENTSCLSHRFVEKKHLSQCIQCLHEK